MPRRLVTRALERAFQTTAEILPKPLLREAFRWSMRGLSVGLCLHRVGEHRSGDPYPHTTAPVEAVDTFLDLVAPRDDDPRAPQVTMCFDDGYADAADYVASRAHRFPKVEWIMFVCPEKVVRRAGFRWDLFEVLRAAGTLKQSLGEFLKTDLSVGEENRRDDLLDIGARPAYRLATHEELLRLLDAPNVKLGNHTNTHFMLTSLRRDEVQQDLVASTAQFTELFGALDEFAFPFGLPDVHFDEAHVMAVRALGNPTLWTTLDGVFAPAERQPGAVLPRIVFRGLWSGKAMTLWVIYVALRHRVTSWRRPDDVTPIAEALHEPEAPARREPAA